MHHLDGHEGGHRFDVVRHREGVIGTNPCHAVAGRGEQRDVAGERHWVARNVDDDSRPGTGNRANDVAACTRSRVATGMLRWPASASETAERDTPARRATSCMETRSARGSGTFSGDFTVMAVERRERQPARVGPSLALTI